MWLTSHKKVGEFKINGYDSGQKIYLFGVRGMNFQKNSPNYKSIKIGEGTF